MIIVPAERPLFRAELAAHVQLENVINQHALRALQEKKENGGALELPIPAVLLSDSYVRDSLQFQYYAELASFPPIVISLVIFYVKLYRESYTTHELLQGIGLIVLAILLGVSLASDSEKFEALQTEKF